MVAIILAAGYATRLYPLTENQPKCLLEVAGKTILDALCEKLDALENLNRIVIVTNAKFYRILTDWSQKAPHRVRIEVLNDGTTSNDTRLGATGDLSFAIQQSKIDDDILLLASDNLFEEDLKGFTSFVHSQKNEICVAVYDIQDKNLAKNTFGVLELDAKSQVVSIEEKPAEPKSSLIGMGIYYLPKTKISRIGQYLADPEAKDAPGYFFRWLLDYEKIFGFRFKGLWYDIGNLEALQNANIIFSKLKH